MITLLCAVLSGAMVYLSQGLDDVWVLAWLAPVPLLWLAGGDTPRRQLFAASVFANAMGSIYFFQAYGKLLWIAGTVVMVGNGVLFALAILFAQTAGRRLSPLAALLAFPALWTTIEYVEGWVSPHGAWGALGYTQVAWPAAIQIAAVTGVYGVTFLLCLFAGAVAMAACGKWRAGMLGFTVCLATIAGGYVRLATPQGEPVHVAALAEVSGDYIKAFDTGDSSAAAAVTAKYAAAIRAEVASDRTKVFVTPETGVELGAVTPMAQVARETGSLVITGTHGRDPARNMAIAFAPGGGTTLYNKRHRLLPGEAIYTPAVVSGYIGGGMAMAICKDLDFPRTMRSDAQARIRLMAVPANDFNRDDWMHARQAVMRGVENGFAVLRSAFSGLETISDAQGRVLASARVDHFGMTVIHAGVPLGPGVTLYSRIGDVFAWLTVAASLALLIALGTSRRSI